MFGDHGRTNRRTLQHEARIEMHGVSVFYYQ